MASAPRFTKLQCFSILGLKEGSSQEEIKKAYRELAMKYHPDHYKGSDNIFKDIQEAYECLENGNFKSERNQEEPKRSKTEYKSGPTADDVADKVVSKIGNQFLWLAFIYLVVRGGIWSVLGSVAVFMLWAGLIAIPILALYAVF